MQVQLSFRKGMDEVEIGHAYISPRDTEQSWQFGDL
jgi:hypothetical protein